MDGMQASCLATLTHGQIGVIGPGLPTLLQVVGKGALPVARRKSDSGGCACALQQSALCHSNRFAGACHQAAGLFAQTLHPSSKSHYPSVAALHQDALPASTS